MNVLVEQIRLEVIKAYYERKYKGRCKANYLIFTWSYYEKDIGLHKLPYFCVDINTIENLLKKYGNKIHKNNYLATDKSIKGILLITPRSKGWDD